MKHGVKYILFLLLLLQLNITAQTITTYSILNTAYNRVTGTYDPVGNEDLNWALVKKQPILYNYNTGGYTNNGPAILVDAPTYIIGYDGNTPFPGIVGDRSISFSTDATTINHFTYTYRTYFTLPNLNQTTNKYSLNLKLSGDDAISEVRLNNNLKVKYIDANGIYIGGPKPNISSIPFCDVGFVSGLNYIDVTVIDQGVSITAFYAEIDLLEMTGGCTGSQIYGKTFEDINSNLIYDGSDVNLKDFQVRLKEITSNLIYNTYTNSNGDYSFQNVPLGNYILEEIVQSPYYITSPVSIKYSVTVSANNQIFNRDFGNENSVSQINGKVFYDMDGNSIYNGQDYYLPSVQVKLTETATNLIYYANTNSTGGYSFLNVPKGNYHIEEIINTPYYVTSPLSIKYSVSVSSNNQIITGRDFGNEIANGQITGTTYLDINQNGIIDGTDTYLPNFLARIVDGSTFLSTDYTTTLYGGFQMWYPKYNRTYQSSVINFSQNGYTRTSPNPGYYNITLTKNQPTFNGNFGFTTTNAPGEIRGKVFNDVDKSGTLSSGDIGLNNSTVNLINLANNQISKTIQTNASGDYTFTAVVQGSYKVVQILTPTAIQTMPNSPEYFVILLANAEIINNIDFGNTNVISSCLTTTTLTSINSNSTICPGQSLTLTSQPADLYLWSTGATTQSIVVAPLSTTVYTVNGMSPGCTLMPQTITVIVSNCTPTTTCTDAFIKIPEGNYCIGAFINMSATGCCNPDAVYNWSFGDGLTATGSNVTHSYQSAGTYNVQLTVVKAVMPAIIKTSKVIIKECVETNCKDCIGSFQPTPGNYVISLWVREDLSPIPKTYNNAKVEISFITTSGPVTPMTVGTNSSKNKIIEGWQRIEETFTIPANATNLKLKLINASTNGVDAYFDDIRVFPLDGQMKTYVYDPITLRLSATLDENNYATFYEYDKEGKLIRIKKETISGIMTIQETREGNKKK